MAENLQLKHFSSETFLRKYFRRKISFLDHSWCINFWNFPVKTEFPIKNTWIGAVYYNNTNHHQEKEHCCGQLLLLTTFLSFAWQTWCCNSFYPQYWSTETIWRHMSKYNFCRFFINVIHHPFLRTWPFPAKVPIFY